MPMIQFRYRYFALLMLGALIAAGLGCTSIPTQEMSDARQAVQAAREANAGVLAAEPMESAEMLLNRARQSLDQGAYDKAREEALAAGREAIKARGEALESNPTP